MDTPNTEIEKNDIIEKRNIKLQAARDRHNFSYQNYRLQSHNMNITSGSVTLSVHPADERALEQWNKLPLKDKVVTTGAIVQV